MTVLELQTLRYLPIRFTELANKIAALDADVPYDEVMAIVRESGLFDDDLVRYFVLTPDYEWNNWTITYYC